MYTYTLGLLSLLFQVSKAFQSSLEFLAAFEKGNLDWIDYTAVLIENPDDFEVQFNYSTYFFLRATSPPGPNQGNLTSPPIPTGQNW